VLSLNRVRSENGLLIHLASWATVAAGLVLINLIASPDVPWSAFPVGIWGAAVGLHAYGVLRLGRRKHHERHRQLFVRAPEGGESLESESVESEVSELRGKLLRSAEEARTALRPISPAVAADVSRGERRALDIVAWLEEAQGVLRSSHGAREQRARVAAELSKPGREATRAALEQLLTQLDLHDVKLATLEREAERRRSHLDSFFLVIESAAVAQSSAEVLAAVAGPLRERVELLEGTAAERAASDPAFAMAGEDDRIHAEIRLAQDFQRSILPQEAPEVPGLAVAHIYQPSSEVGGDFFDFYVTGEQRLLVAVGDASGHGLDSSMVSSMAKSALYTQVSAGRGLGDSMAEMNRLMCDTLGRRRLMTLALLEIDVPQRRLSWVNAGQVFPLVIRDGEVRELEQSSYPLGVRRDSGYAEKSEPLVDGDALLLLTDGYFEALSPAGQVFGWDRLLAKLAGRESSQASELVGELERELAGHLGGGPPQDDVTLVAVELTA
jgi:serine phosphatase RsbU (regulator of sigma subunit)